MRPNNLTGQTFGRLTVIRRDGNSKAGERMWKCRCECGNIHRAGGVRLTSGVTMSCGCWRREVTGLIHRTHGMRHTPEYRAWANARARCYNSKCQGYKNYGGKGITVCERWRTFENFFADMGLRPSADHSIDRKDNFGNFEPGNCRWATRIEQNNKRSIYRLLTHNGRTMTMAQWGRERGYKKNVIPDRLKRGWSVAESIGNPLVVFA